MTETNYVDEVDTIYEVPHPDNCNYGGPGGSPPIVEKVDPEKLSGFFYQHKIDVGQLVFQGKDTICAALQFDVKDGYVLDTAVSQNGDPATSKTRVVEGIKVFQDDPALQGKLRVLFPAGSMGPDSPSFNSTEWILKLGPEKNGKYDYWIASAGDESYSAFFFNSRSREVPEDVANLVNKFIEDTHFSVTVQDVGQPDNCDYGPISPNTPQPSPVAPTPEKISAASAMQPKVVTIVALLISMASLLA